MTRVRRPAWGADRGRLLHARQPAAVVVTDAQPSRSAAVDRRRRRYLLTMGVRTVVFLLAVFLFRGWLRLVAAGLSLVLPYVAVVAANAGSRTHDRPTPYLPRPAEQVELSAGEHATDTQV